MQRLIETSKDCFQGSNDFVGFGALLHGSYLNIAGAVQRLHSGEVYYC